MCQADRRAHSLRRPCVESLETRLALSGHAITDAISPIPSSIAPPLSPADKVDTLADLSYAHQQLGLTGRGQTVAVIDSGVAYDHPALGAGWGPGYRVVGGWDFTEENDADPWDDPPGGFHGTHVAGIIGSDDLQYPGVAPDVHLVALRVFNDQGASDFRWVEQALQWVHVHKNSFPYPITTVNLSLGAHAEASSDGVNLEDELAQLQRDGIFVAVAAGNDFDADAPRELNHPADSRYVVPVASYGTSGAISSFSQRSAQVLVAPGEQITSTVPDFIEDFNGVTDDFLAISGTSSAAPFVAGASVLVRQALQARGVRQIDQQLIEQVLRQTSHSVYDPMTRSHYAHLDLPAALDAALQWSAPDPVNWNGSVLEVSGTAGDDVFRLTVEPRLELVVNDVEYDFGPQRPTIVRLRGGAGTDSLYVTAGSTDDKAVLRARSLRFETPTLEIVGSNFERQHIVGGGGLDEADFRGAAGVDIFRGRPMHSVMRGEGYWNKVRDFALVEAYAGRTGRDRAVLIGSSGPDTLYGFSQNSLLTGVGYTLHTHGFSAVHGSALPGGQDTAFLDVPRRAASFGHPRSGRVVTRRDATRVVSGFPDVRFLGPSRSRAIAARFGWETLDPKHVDAAFLAVHSE